MLISRWERVGESNRGLQRASCAHSCRDFHARGEDSDPSVDNLSCPLRPQSLVCACLYSFGGTLTLSPLLCRVLSCWLLFVCVLPALSSLMPAYQMFWLDEMTAVLQRLMHKGRAWMLLDATLRPHRSGRKCTRIKFWNWPKDLEVERRIA